MESSETWQWSNLTKGVLTRAKDNTFYFYGKRCLDVVLAGSLLLVLLPLMVVIAILIWLDTPGPIFYIQERVGTRRRSRGGQIMWEIQNFRMYKFRSMVHNADPALHIAYIKAFVGGSAEPTQVGGPAFKLTNDPRITRIGRILRKTSMDELPQLINVLKGDMSLVGPRPVPVYEVAEYQDWHHERLATLPGITGLWQTQGRCQVSFEEMIRMDIDYVHRQSFWLDLKLMVLTIPAVLLGRGAE
jgi:lipopolysaccharide/colanic/teichoic acid biosynthesis glycosyltransferase